jgi:hypothetical protein
MRKLLVQKIFRRAEFFAAAVAPLDCGWRRRLSSAAEGSTLLWIFLGIPRRDVYKQANSIATIHGSFCTVR